MNQTNLTPKRNYKATIFEMIYNQNKEEMPDRLEMKLSDSFLEKEEEPALELTVVMLNINKGHNKELLDSCKTLRDYVEYTDRVRRYAKVMDLADAVERAITNMDQTVVLDGLLNEYQLSKENAQSLIEEYWE